MKTKTTPISLDNETTRLGESIKLGVDVHIEKYVVVMKIDGSSPCRPPKLHTRRLPGMGQAAKGKMRRPPQLLRGRALRLLAAPQAGGHRRSQPRDTPDQLGHARKERQDRRPRRDPNGPVPRRLPARQRPQLQRRARAQRRGGAASQRDAPAAMPLQGAPAPGDEGSQQRDVLRRPAQGRVVGGRPSRTASRTTWSLCSSRCGR